ncbi:phage baseplate assembly protein [Acinetobacter tandoii]
MQDNLGKEIRLVVNGLECSNWDEASIDSAIDTPADGWSLTLWNPSIGNLDTRIKAGATAKVYYGNELVLTGIIDNLKDVTGRSGRVINLNGRDLAGQLLDCSVPIFNGKQLTLQELINRYVKSGNLASLFNKFEIQNQSWLKNKISVEPSESIWDSLAKAAQVTGQHIWIKADGTLVVGDPFTNSYQVQTSLSLMSHGNGNNVINAEYDEDVSQVFTDIQILSQDADANKILAEGTSNTPYVHKRLKLITSGEVENQAEAQALLKKIIHDNDLEAYSLNCDIAGWLIDGKVWQTGWTVNFQSDVQIRANAKWVVMGRTLNLSRNNGKTTRLKLKRQGDWAQPLKLKQEQPKQQKLKIQKTERGAK